MSAPSPVQRTALQLYRDCLRLVRHIAPGNSPKGIALRTTVKAEFGKHKGVKDEAQIEVLKAGAIRALSNYMLYESGAKDEKLGSAMNKFNESTRTGNNRNGDEKS
mmetsp:Transcript_10965/g.15959  ORF Transcript_10965/g.15959 Transcript_10965/m.15959 type:complete len:106 (-) Transcript_10965:96-413(-)